MRSGADGRPDQPHPSKARAAPVFIHVYRDPYTGGQFQGVPTRCRLKLPYLIYRIRVTRK